MRTKNNPEVNAGVHTNLGMDFQKNCTIYLFLEKYNELKNQRYFIILEHLEDIIFGFLENQTELSKIETYQAKKSPSKWTLNSKVLEIIKKITLTSQSILDDPHPKTKEFLQENYFATNNTIELQCVTKKKKYVCNVNESNDNCKYVNLDKDLKDKIGRGNKNVTFTADNISNLETLSFIYIDLARTTKSQWEQLNGKFSFIFKDSILDHKAALSAFYYALHEVETTFNQGNVAFLNDNKKRIESAQIEQILKILTTKKLAYEFWRKKGEQICKELNITLYNTKTFELHYLNSFDKFKDIKEGEHNKIYNFTLNNKHIFNSYLTDIDCIIGFVDAFNKEKSTTLSDLQLKATIAAAYFEIKDTL